MPVGVQLIGAHGQDAALFALARSLVAGSES
jgi:Asp-tRNA(Asn)/Glu-tRNA(Gln) amidotransferase A subunit family amidase